ncbi:MAG: PKD domain-containing protein [Anaerolineae bacterium]|nr:PKD domain-containing protein [Anaerolineae bacterium]
MSGIVLAMALILTVTARRNLARQPWSTEPAHTRQVTSTADDVGSPYTSRQAPPSQPIQAGQRTQIPPMYQATEGPRGVPAARRCEGCFQVPAPARNGADPAPPAPLAPITGTVSGWEILEAQGFEDEWPWPGLCQIVYDGSDDGFDRTWDGDDYRPHTGDRAAWPAAGGTDGIDPQPPVNYPDNLNSWLVCGPFDLSDASSAYAAFWLWSQVEESHDDFFFGVNDGSDDWFYGFSWDVVVPSWTEYTVYFPSFTGSPAHDSIWVAWNFESDEDNPVAYEGSWLDDIEIARALPCSATDPGNKGLHVHPGELPGQVERIADAGTDWVRLELQMEPDGSLDLDRYAGIVDSLCEYGIAVIGLVNYTTIPPDLDGDGKEDWNDPEDYIPYQQLFTETVEYLSHHFRGSIRHWEIWNEENGALWHIDPEYYARLLVKVSETAKAVDPDNQILLGGLDHVWATSQYLEPLYDAWDQHWAGARPFDILAVHPYFTKVGDEFILDPNVYLWDDGEPPQTILDAYLDYMDSRGDGNKDIWITEIGWNSALDNPAIGNCPDMKPWCVGRAVQAQHLGASFDILFHEVEDPEGNHDRVKTIVWYQYHDTTSTAEEMARRLGIDPATLSSDLEAICPADWGLVDGNREPKLAYWAFQTYPQAPLEAINDSPTPLGSPTELMATLTFTPSAEFTYTWAFGDGDSGWSALVTHTYPYTGVYAAVVTASKSISDWFTTATTITVEEVISGLSAINDSPTSWGFHTTLTATVAAGSQVGYRWAFGDGEIGVGSVITHTYTAASVYTAVVTASNHVSELTATTKIEIVTPPRFERYLPLVLRHSP